MAPINFSQCNNSESVTYLSELPVQLNVCSFWVNDLLERGEKEKNVEKGKKCTFTNKFSPSALELLFLCLLIFLKFTRPTWILKQGLSFPHGNNISSTRSIHYLFENTICTFCMGRFLD